MNTHRDTPLTLSSLQPGQSASIDGYLIGPSPLRRRLLALGLTPGAMLEVLRRAPLGDPIEIQVRGANFALRRFEADALAITPVGAA
ncbi:FeoA domain-containing protein [Burkholderiaceae bacterium DAT-1]|nr:FeoA domain-containing protein [Burkholderiaceae bacterium DAT-1]